MNPQQVTVVVWNELEGGKSIKLTLPQSIIFLLHGANSGTNQPMLISIEPMAAVWTSDKLQISTLINIRPPSHTVIRQGFANATRKREVEGET